MRQRGREREWEGVGRDRKRVRVSLAGCSDTREPKGITRARVRHAPSLACMTPPFKTVTNYVFQLT